ncbi:UNKNOWN [Stylonychia lemnae]|uniref:Uncharacterized protein n=1 Tax=Stylonychia lemnae TaxID=5949 RepID=A0A077ZM73_STYLE|nr:UNKNOWN [Stylonychia lemnae]|eukprot:CDW71078.1 UNKNOWN [Stylonychia lemnae]
MLAEDDANIINSPYSFNNLSTYEIEMTSQQIGLGNNAVNQNNLQYQPMNDINNDQNNQQRQRFASIQEQGEDKIMVIVGQILCQFGIIQSLGLGLFNFRMLSSNLTMSAFDKGSFVKNIESVMGPLSWKWVLPIRPDLEGDGCSFEINQLLN